MVEVPLHELQPKTDPTKTQAVNDQNNKQKMDVLAASDFVVFLPTGPQPGGTGPGASFETIFVFPRPQDAATENHSGTDDSYASPQPGYGDKNVIHKNEAARHKSRLAVRLKAMAG